MRSRSLFASRLRWSWLTPVAALIAVFHFAGMGGALDHAFHDAASRQPWRPPPLDPAASALVLIDEHTMAEAKREGFGLRWPFPRAAFAGLIVALDRAGAEAIVMDFTFLEPDSADQDQLLAAVAAAVPGVVLGRTVNQPPVFWDEAFVAAHPSHFTRTRAGNADLVTDSDGIARRYRLRDSLAAVAADVRAGEGTALLRWHGGLDAVRERGVPVVSAARFFNPGLHLLDRLYEVAADPDTAEWNLERLRTALANEPPLTGAEFDAVRGRTVFVGANASGTFDLKPLPVGQLEPGVLLHWTAWSNLRAGGFIEELPRWLPLALGGAFMLVLAAAGTRQGRLGGAILIAVLLVAATVIAAYSGLSAGWYLPPATPVVAVVLTLTGVAAEGLWTEHRRRLEVQTMFGSYVDPAVVDRLVRDPNAIRLSGERREATVFFCDLAGFTDLSEQVSPETLLALINSYLEETSDCLLAHGAYIDKYIGDAVMAVFGAPQAQPDHAYAAGRASLAAQQVLARMNKRLQVEHGRTLRMRIGLNTGPMLVGNLGSARKRNYTVLGDAVNLASRLEGANKEFGTAILIGEETARQIGERLVVRPLTRLRVKGKQQAVEVSELIGVPGELPPETVPFLAAYRPAYAAFTHRNFAAAAAGFQAALALRPDDRMTAALLAEAERLTRTPPSSDWEPVLTLSTK